jgi:hypothetical protein
MAQLLASGARAAHLLGWTLLYLTTIQVFVHIAHFGVSRGDENRIICFCDFGKPYKLECLSSAVDAYVLPVALFGSKTQHVGAGVG